MKVKHSTGCQDLSEKLFESILNGDSRTEINQVIRDIESDMLDITLTSDADFGQPMGVKRRNSSIVPPCGQTKIWERSSIWVISL